MTKDGGEVNTRVAWRRLPDSCQLTDEQCHTLETTLNELTSELLPGVVVEVTYIPTMTGIKRDIYYRVREEGVVN